MGSRNFDRLCQPKICFETVHFKDVISYPRSECGFERAAVLCLRLKLHCFISFWIIDLLDLWLYCVQHWGHPAHYGRKITFCRGQDRSQLILDVTGYAFACFIVAGPWAKVISINDYFQLLAQCHFQLSAKRWLKYCAILAVIDFILCQT